ncbi:T9SS type A sorting domain-containing protein [bacterium]|nr:T9SS type A sorting domain-containing protein [bacterium]
MIYPTRKILFTIFCLTSLLISSTLLFAQEGIELLSTIENESWERVWDVTYEDNLLYVCAASEGMFIYNVEDLENPELLGEFTTGATMRQVTIKSEYAYIAAASQGMYVVDISTPTNPVLRSQLEIDEFTWTIDVHGNMAYATEFGDIYAIDISDPDDPEILSVIDARCCQRKALIRDGISYSPSENWGFQTIDVSDIFNPVQLDMEREYSGTAYDVALQGDYAYVAYARQGILVYDISDPSDIFVAGRTWEYNNIFGIDVQDGYAYFTNSSNGISVLDISNPVDPAPVGSHDVEGVIYGLAINPPYAFIPAGNTVSIFDCSEAIGYDDQEEVNIPLATNRYELVSMPRLPLDLFAINLFEDIPHLAIVQNEQGQVHIPDLIDADWMVNPTEAYMIYTSEESEWVYTGTTIRADHEFNLQPDTWNWIGYPFTDEMLVEQAMEPIYDELEIILNDDGEIFIPDPDFNINTMGNMTPGEGYRVFVNEEVDLEYPEELERAGAFTTEKWNIPEIEDTPHATGLPWVVLVTLDESMKQQAAVIELYDGNVLVGRAAVLEDKPVTPVTAWQAIPEHDIPGFFPGNPISVKVLDESGEVVGESGSANVSSSAFGKGPYAEITVSAIENESELPLELSMGKAYPNPFNPSITVPFTLPEKMEVSLSLYNIVGQLVAELNQGVLDRGHHELVFEAVNQTSGVYFLVLKAGEHHAMQKVILLK